MVPQDLIKTLALIWKGARSASSLEGQTLDFKTEKQHTKETAQDLAEAAVCFANASGGTLVVGISDNGTGPAAFLGAKLDTENLRSRIHALTEPALVSDVDELMFEGQRLVVIRVPQGLDVYATKKGLVTRRWNGRAPWGGVDRSRAALRLVLTMPSAGRAGRSPRWGRCGGARSRSARAG